MGDVTQSYKCIIAAIVSGRPGTIMLHMYAPVLKGSNRKVQSDNTSGHARVRETQKEYANKARIV